MSLSEFNNDVKNHTKLPDKPALTANELKEIFDKAPQDIKDFINNVLIKEIDRELDKKVSNKEGYRLISAAEAAKLEKIEENATNTKITYGTKEPDANTDGKYYIQYFN